MRFEGLFLCVFAYIHCCVASSIVLQDAELSFVGTDRPALSLKPIDENYDYKKAHLNVPVSVSETLKISFVANQELYRANLLVGVPANELEAGYTFSQKDKTFSVEIPLSKVANSFKGIHKNQLTVTLLVASEQESLVKDLALLTVTDLKPSESTVVRFAPKKEIHHVFQAAPKTVNAFIAQLFALVIATTLFALLISWVSFGVFSFSLGSVSSYVFVALIAAFEFIFYRYYVGTSIFNTLLSALLLFFPALLFGSATLKSLKH